MIFSRIAATISIALMFAALISTVATAAPKGENSAAQNACKLHINDLVETAPVSPSGSNPKILGLTYRQGLETACGAVTFVEDSASGSEASCCQDAGCSVSTQTHTQTIDGVECEVEITSCNCGEGVGSDDLIYLMCIASL